MLNIMVPPVLSKTGKNFTSGRKMNFSLAKNFAIKMSTTPRGPKAFLSLSHTVGSFGRPQSCSDCGAVAGGVGGGYRYSSIAKNLRDESLSVKANDPP